MKVDLSVEAKLYIELLIKKVAKTNEVNPEIQKKLKKLARKFEGESAYISLKKPEAESLIAFFGLVIDICNKMIEDKDTIPERKEIAEKRKELLDHVTRLLEKAMAANSSKSRKTRVSKS